MEITLAIRDQAGEIIAASKGENETALCFDTEYSKCDSITISFLPAVTDGVFAYIMLDDAMGEELIYLKGDMTYRIPFGDEALNLSPGAFWGERYFHDGAWQKGERHLLSVRLAKPYETDGYRELATNRYDQAEAMSYPHASSNIETRGESVFAARCAIDGLFINSFHGEWPYTSWGLDIKEPAPYFRVDFGRRISTDRIRLHIRADFPHDNWWVSVRATFSDKSEETLYLQKTASAQEFTFAARDTEWIMLDRLLCCENDPSPFPALMLFEVFGRG